MGAHVTGVEPQQENISAAVAHAQQDPLIAARTKYLALTAEELAGSGITDMQHQTVHVLLTCIEDLHHKLSVGREGNGYCNFPLFL